MVGIFSELREVPLNTVSSKFVILMRALERYLTDTGGVPPLPGVLPDLTASTEYFVRLQEVYSKKALSDRLIFRAIVEDICKSSGCAMVEDDHIDMFCVNVRSVQFINTGILEEELQGAPIQSLGTACSDPYSDSLQVLKQHPWFLL